MARLATGTLGWGENCSPFPSYDSVQRTGATGASKGDLRGLLDAARLSQSGVSPPAFRRLWRHPWNYYMWHGGTHFGRNAMYLQTISYGLDTPLDEDGRATLKPQHLARLHSLVRERGQLMLGGERSRQVEPDGAEVATWTSGGETLRILLDPAQLTGRVLDGHGRVLFDTAGDYDAVTGDFLPCSWETAATPPGSQSWREPMPPARPRGVIAAEPLEQLGLTRDQTDYCARFVF